MKIYKTKYKSQILYSGRSMIEMIGVIAIMGIITTMSMEAYKVTISTLKTNRTTEDLTTIQQAVHLAYKNKTYEGITSNLIPSTIRAFPGGANEKLNQYGGKYTIEPGENNLSFIIAVTNVPKKDCLIFTKKNRPGIKSIEIDGAKGYPSKEATPPALLNQCTDSNTSTIKFEYE